MAASGFACARKHYGRLCQTLVWCSIYRATVPQFRSVIAGGEGHRTGDAERSMRLKVVDSSGQDFRSFNVECDIPLRHLSPQSWCGCLGHFTGPVERFFVATSPSSLATSATWCQE